MLASKSLEMDELLLLLLLFFLLNEFLSEVCFVSSAFFTRHVKILDRPLDNFGKLESNLRSYFTVRDVK